MRGGLILLCGLVTSGCYGASTDVVAPTAKVPVSLSRAVHDANGSIVELGEREVVGTFSYDTTVWSLAYGAADLHGTTDISEAINAQVGEQGGDAVTNLEITGKACGWGMVLGFNLLPLWPGCEYIEVRGDIIRVRRDRREAAR